VNALSGSGAGGSSMGGGVNTTGAHRAGGGSG
jgi:hypothetical protein